MGSKSIFRDACLFLKYSTKSKIPSESSRSFTTKWSDKIKILNVRQFVFTPVRNMRSTVEDAGLAKYALLVIPIVTFGLGSWQVQRRSWKLDLIAEMSKKTSVEPVELPHNLEELEDMEFRKIRVRGTFDHTKEMFIGPRSLLVSGDVRSTGSMISSGQSGFNVVTPFKLVDQEVTILVNRGWIPRKNKNPSTRLDGLTEGIVELTGIVRKHEVRPPFMQKTTPGGDCYLYRDLEVMARLTDSAPVLIDAVETFKSGPVGSQTRVNVRNEHMQYLFTWYALSFATSLLWHRKFILGKPLM